MEFTTEAELCDFLADWLEAHGHNIYRQIKCPEGGKIDILTQDYAIACRQWLTPNALLDAIDELAACESHVAQHRSVVAGLTPPTDFDAELSPQPVAESESGLEPITLTPAAEDVSIAASIAQAQAAGIEVWFLDQIEALQAYYQQLGAVPTGIPIHKGAKDRRRWSPWAGVSVAVGMAGILAVSFTLAYRILQEPVAAPLSPDQQVAWDNLHTAAEVWDLQTAQDALQRLRRSNNPCASRFANRLQTLLDQQGAEGFREINPIKRALNQQEGCDLEVTVYKFSP